MSYSFDGANDSLNGDFTSTYQLPVSLFAWIKFTDHPIAVDCVVNFGNNASDANDSVIIRLTGTDNTFGAAAINAAGGASQATAVKTGIDGTWVPYIGVFTNDDLRDVYISDQTGQNTENRVVATALRSVRVGETLAGGSDYTGLIAEVAIWDIALDATARSNLQAGMSPSLVNASDLIGYWPLSQDGVLTNEGLDAAGDFTVVGGAVFNADHPTITGAGSAKKRRRLLMGIG